ncbi:MAG: leucine-rich repeat domain-containing protein [Bacteroidaceae bacterium]|nr:leucine-rich repeat domain-containing protein [Bacteroidaceae bacterium]
MKTKQLLFLIVTLCMPLSLYAHDFEVDGIYYDIENLSNKTVAVTYKGEQYDSYSNEYTGIITIPSNVTYYGVVYRVTSIGFYAFGGCSGLHEVTIPNSVTSISNNAFRGCTGLTSISIPNSVTEIGDNALYYCAGLTEVTIPNSITKIGTDAFGFCTSLTKVTIPESVTLIGMCAFGGCTGLTEVTIPNRLDIDNYVFYGCSGIHIKFVENKKIVRRGYLE